jgi:hypothetical protein
MEEIIKEWIEDDLGVSDLKGFELVDSPFQGELKFLLTMRVKLHVDVIEEYVEVTKPFYTLFMNDPKRSRLDGIRLRDFLDQLESEFWQKFNERVDWVLKGV